MRAIPATCGGARRHDDVLSVLSLDPEDPASPVLSPLVVASSAWHSPLLV
jgi:hypothetical protein